MPQPTPLGQTFWVTLAILIVVVLRFLARELRERRVRMSMLFVIPGFLGLIALWLCYLTLTRAPQFSGELALEALAALVVGTGIGLAVAHFTRVRSGGPNLVLIRGSWITVAIWIGALLLRLAGRAAFATSNLDTQLLLNSGLVLMLAFATTVVRLRVLQERRRLPD
jgi:hypothetical protein